VENDLLGAIVERIGDLVPFGVWLSDAAGALIYVSDSFLEMTGATRAACAGLGWASLVHPRDRARTLARWSVSVHDGADFSNEHRIRGRGGAYYSIRSRAIPMRDGDGKVRAWIGVNHDITDRKRFVSELRAARDAAEKASRAKDELVAAISHELRNPLTPVLAAAQMLADDADTPPHARLWARRIQANTELEARLIDDLVDLTRLARGALQLSFESVELDRVVEHALETCRETAVSKGVTLESELTSGAHVQADAARLQQIFWHLLKNAVHFTAPGGKVKVNTALDDGIVVASVHDTGIGISAEKLASLFRQTPAEAAHAQRHAHNGNDSSTDQGGFGLAVAQALVKLHGGRIIAMSDGRDKGATFEVRLQVVAGEQAAAVRQPGEKKITILLVDDHKDTCVLMRSMLVRRGFEVLVAEDGRTALELAEKHEFDLLVSDLGLPDVSGLELIAQLRRKGPVVAIAMTGFGREEDVARCKEAGFAEHMTKPISMPKLEEAIRRLTAA
jgi:PAS domain S-box-containing protein